MSRTGNTRKVAEAIYKEIKCEKEIKRVEEVKGLEGYDLAFLGFPIHGYGPDRKARRFLERETKDQKIALFITHASPRVKRNSRDIWRNSGMPLLERS